MGLEYLLGLTAFISAASLFVDLLLYQALKKHHEVMAEDRKEAKRRWSTS